MSLVHDIRALVPKEGTQVLVSSSLLRQIRSVLVNSPRDDEEIEFLLSQFQSKEPVMIEKHILDHMVDFLRGELM